MPNLSSVAVANRFIELGLKNNRPVTQFHIYRLSYFAHGLCLAMYKQPLITEKEPFEAWPLGPVLRSLYEGPLKGMKYTRITNNIPTNDSSDNNNLIDQDTIIIDSIYRIMIGRYHTGQLSDKTHAREGAWHIAYNTDVGTVIDTQAILNEWVNNTQGNTIEERINAFNDYSDTVEKVFV